jgi:hypothetical protein
MPLTQPPEFDAFIDLSDGDLPPGMPPEEAVELVRDALARLPGAGRIFVSHWGDTLVLPSPVVKIWGRGQQAAKPPTEWLSIVVRRACRDALAEADRAAQA